MKRWFTRPTSLAATLLLAAPAGIFGQETDGPPAPPPVDAPAAVAPANGSSPDETKQDNTQQDSKQNTSDVIEVVASKLHDVVQDVEIVASQLGNAEVDVIQDGVIQDSANGYWLGVVCEDCDDALKAQLGLAGKGLIVREVVEESPASSAGLQVHDILLSLGDDQLTGQAELSKAIAQADGKPVYLQVIRGGDHVKLQVKPEKRHVIRLQGHPTVTSQIREFSGNVVVEGGNENVILDTVKSLPSGQSFSYQVVRPGVITSDVVTTISPQEVEIIQLEGKLRAAIQGGKGGEIEDVIVTVNKDGNVKQRVVKGHVVVDGQKKDDDKDDDDDEDSASDKHQLRLELKQTDDNAVQVVVVKDGKTYQVTGDNLDDLPEDVREQVKMLKDGKLFMGSGSRVIGGKTIHGFGEGGLKLFGQLMKDDDADDDDADDDDADDDKQKSVQRSYFYRVERDGKGGEFKTVEDQEGEKVEVRIEKQDGKPAQIIIKKGDKTWEVDENSLDKLPEEVRGKIKVWQPKDGAVFQFGGEAGKQGLLELRRGQEGAFHVLGDGQFKFEPKGEFKFQAPKLELKDGKAFQGHLELKEGQLFERKLELTPHTVQGMRLAPGNRFFVTPKGSNGVVEVQGRPTGDLGAKIDALNKEIQALRKAIEHLADTMDKN